MSKAKNIRQVEIRDIISTMNIPRKSTAASGSLNVLEMILIRSVPARKTMTVTRNIRLILFVCVMLCVILLLLGLF